MDEEIWRPAVGFERFYDVSDQGRVRRVGAVAGARVHQLVAAAFLGPCPQDFQINHMDGDKTNARPSNLEYVTCQGNIQHAIQYGLRQPGKPPHHRGERNPASKLCESDVRAIRASRETNIALGRTYGVSNQVVSDIRRMKTWTHVA
jgi:hypothetical protein